MSVLVCPRCGRTSDKVAFIESFCIDCYPLSIKVPDRVELEQCARCGRIRLRGEWTPFSEKKLADLVLSRCKGDFIDAGYGFEHQTAWFLVKGGSARVERKIPLLIRRTVCPQCSRISGGYFEAIIQLRGDRRRMDKYADMFVKRLQKKTFITKTEEKDGGLDLYIGNSKAVVAMMGEMGLKVLMTKKLVGREEGKRLYRTTFLLRL
jgi:nonsense-mediated mRNA decay protein 3